MNWWRRLNAKPPGWDAPANRHARFWAGLVAGLVFCLIRYKG